MTCKVTVIKGGNSSEREVSLATGSQCASALISKGYKVTEIDTKYEFLDHLKQDRPDIVFNALHGRWGEDGTIQGVLEWLSLPYTHSGVLASALAMDKKKSKEIFRHEGLPVSDGFIMEAKKLELKHPIEPPYVIKPNNEGSSVGVLIISEEKLGQLKSSLSKLPKFVLVEPFVRGKELTVAVMDNRVLTITDIVTSGWYDYTAKYTEGQSEHIVPAIIPENVKEACFDYALRAHNSIGCRGLTRTDFRWDDNLGVDGIKILEINTQPGMTSTSLVPEQAKFCGISFPDLCDWIVKDASCCR